MAHERPLKPIPTGLQFFDPQQSHSIGWKTLPHWAQSGAVTFITWRTADSLPKALIVQLARQRETLLSQHCIDPAGDWREAISHLPVDQRTTLQWSLFVAWDEQLDLAAGACYLRHAQASSIVMQSLLHFDNDRYVLTDAVVMPNHVHLLVAFREEDSLLRQCTSWKHFTATKINQWLREEQGVPAAGEFWQVEQFDHLVRSPEGFERYRNYLAENLRSVHLPLTEDRYYTRLL